MGTNTSKQAIKTSQNEYFFRLLGLILCVGAAISVLTTGLSIYAMEILPLKYFLILFLIDAALVAVPFCLFASGRTSHGFILRVGAYALAVLMLCINLLAASSLGKVSDLLENQYTTGGGYIEYSIVAQRVAGVKLSEQHAIRAGIQSTDVCKNEAEQETQKLTDAAFTEYDNLADLIDATAGTELDVAVVQTAFLNTYGEYFPDSYENLEIVATFKAGSAYQQYEDPNLKIDVTKPFAIYVSGMDDYGDIDKTGRSDVNMLVLIDPQQYKILLINTPRDYYVQLHGTTGTKDKLTHAGTYGIEMGEQTLEDLYGFEIDYHVLINYDTLINLVDAMGGVVVNNPSVFSIWGNSYAAGEIYLTGDYALMYVRARGKDGVGLSGGDIDRGANQQRLIEAIVDRITKPWVVTYYSQIIQGLNGTFRSNIPPKLITQLFNRQISLGGHWTIEKMGATGTNAQRPTYSMGAQELSVVLPDEQSLEEIRAAIREFMLNAS